MSKSTLWGRSYLSGYETRINAEGYRETRRIVGEEKREWTEAERQRGMKLGSWSTLPFDWMVEGRDITIM